MVELIDKKEITESRELTKVITVLELTPYINVEDLIQFVDNLPSVSEKEIRAKAITEFAEKLCDAISEQYANVEVNGIKFDVLTVDGITEIAWDLADELLKGEQP